MYRMEVYKDGKLVRRLNFLVSEGLEMLEYRRKYQLDGCGVQVWRLMDEVNIITGEPV